MHRPSPSIHHNLSVRFVIIGKTHHKHLAFEAEVLTRKTQGTPPLSRTSFCGYFFYPFHFIVIGLRNCGIGLMTPRRTHPFILVVYFGWGIEHLLQIIRAIHGRRTPHTIDVTHLIGDGHVFICGYLLLDELHRE